MSQLNLFNHQQALFERICSIDELQLAFKAVKRNHGAPGVDGVTVEGFAERLSEELSQLKNQLESWKYEPLPVRRVEIPKAGGGIRLLGIPAVRDRVVQTALKTVLEEILEPMFSDSSFGFRRNRNQSQAVAKAQMLVKSGKPYVVDIDLSRFFDRIHHDRLIHRLSLHVKDTRILRLVGITLRGEIMKDGLVSGSTEGSVQGSPVSPLLSNLVLDELDKELEARGLSFCRWADDCNIFLSSEKAAKRVMGSITRFIEKKLKLVVNREKSQVAISSKVKFLGMTIVAGLIAVSPYAMKRAMGKVRELTPRGTSVSSARTVEDINGWYVGWANYFKMTQYPSQLASVEAHVRRRLRARIISEQKRKRNLFDKLKKRGIQRRLATSVFGNQKRWALSHSYAVEKAYSNSYFIQILGQKIVSRDALPHWRPLKDWIKLT